MKASKFLHFQQPGCYIQRKLIPREACGSLAGQMSFTTCKEKVALFKPVSDEFQRRETFGKLLLFELFGNVVGDRVLDSRETTVHWVPSLFRWRARVHGGPLGGRSFEGWWQPAAPKGSKLPWWHFLSALIRCPGGLGGCWLQQRLIFLLSELSSSPKWLLMPRGKTVLCKLGRLGTHCLVWACLATSSSPCKQFLGSLIFPRNVLMWRFCSSGCFHSLQRRIVMGRTILPHWHLFLHLNSSPTASRWGTVLLLWSSCSVLRPAQGFPTPF